MTGNSEDTKAAGKPTPFRLKVIRPIYETLTVGDPVAAYLKHDDTLTTSAQVAELFDFLRRETKEQFWAVHLSAKNRILCLDLVSVGSLCASVVHPREVFKSVLLSSASAILVVHNHPSGDTTPSAEDREITRRLKEAGEMLGIRILDHVIVGEGYFSFADHGLL